MKVISVKQPWASLIINGYKQYEFRSWNTKFRGPVLIHASKTIEKEYLPRFASLNLEYPTGAILGSVTIYDCLPVTKDWEEELICENELVYGASRGRGSYAFAIDHVQKFDVPIEAKGMLGFWDFSLEGVETENGS